MTHDAVPSSSVRETLKSVVIRFAGDSGDGMQLVGSLFTGTTAIAGNDLATLPDFPAEIRAPAGTLPGVSGFQIHFASRDVYTPGDEPDALVAMNPAALKANLPDLKDNGILVVNTDTFTEVNLKKVGYAQNPLESGKLSAYRVVGVAVTELTKKALAETDLSNKEKDRCKNFFALGLMLWLFNRPPEPVYRWIERKFAKDERLAEANRTALKAGFAYGDASELFQTKYEVPKAQLPPGRYRNINGNEALAVGLVAAAQKAKLPLFYGSYPITPASEVLHYLSRYKHYDVLTFQAEDEMAAVGAAVGAAFAGQLAVTASSGPGVALKMEFISLAISVELPLIVLDVQRAGPSTGMPTKPEQADLLQVLYGRFGEAPVAVIAPRDPADCFDAAFEAARIALTYMMPVFLLSDGYLATGASPWRVPDVADLPALARPYYNGTLPAPEEFAPLMRDHTTLARPWITPGTAGYEHRVGGLEKAETTGEISYEPGNHQRMTELRYERIRRIADELPPAVVEGEQEGELLIVGWGSTYGAIKAARERLETRGTHVGHLHLRHMNPLPPNLGEILPRFRRIVVPEMNMGQLRMILRATYLVDAIGINKVRGRPFAVDELVDRINEIQSRCSTINTTGSQRFVPVQHPRPKQ